MKAFSVAQAVAGALTALVLAGCATPEPASVDGTKVAAAPGKCNRVVDAPLGALSRKDCTGTSDAKTVDKREFMDSLQTPGAVPQSGR
jgi:hypothetical protein